MTNEEYFKSGNIVYVEPGKGYARIKSYAPMKSLQSEEKNVTVVFDILGGDGREEGANEDNVFLMHEESYYNQLESRTRDLMDSAGNYTIPNNVNEMLEDIRQVIEAYRLALETGQVRRRG